MEVGYSRLVTISTDNMLLTNEYRTASALIGPFYPIRGRKVQKISTSPVYGSRAQSDDPACHRPRTRSSLFKILQRLLVFCRPTIEELRQDLRAVLRNASGLGHHYAELKAAWEQGQRDAFIPGRQRLRAGIFGSKSRGGGRRRGFVQFVNSHQFQIVRRRISPFAFCTFRSGGRIGAKIYKIETPIKTSRREFLSNPSNRFVRPRLGQSELVQARSKHGESNSKYANSGHTGSKNIPEMGRVLGARIPAIKRTLMGSIEVRCGVQCVP